jgi:hypothetical protein
MHINCYMYYIVYVCVRMLPAGSAKLIMECCHNYRVAKPTSAILLQTQDHHEVTNLQLYGLLGLMQGT